MTTQSLVQAAFILVRHLLCLQQHRIQDQLSASAIECSQLLNGEKDEDAGHDVRNGDIGHCGERGLD
jgi:hypothetical protein